MLSPINFIKELFDKYNDNQLLAVMHRNYFAARDLGVSLEDYLSLIR